MTLEEQMKLAIECGAYESTQGGLLSWINFTLDELAAYTAAVEARERERCVAAIRNLAGSKWVSIEAAGDCEDAIRELK